MKVIGLTGGIGMGKSTAADMLRRRNVPVVDTDDLARDVVAPGQPALAEVVAVFGRDVLDPSGALRRDELARRVFNNPAARKQLEGILHPRIRELWKARVKAWEKEGHELAVVVIPLLFETRAEAELDVTVCLACTHASQLKRLLARGWSSEQIEGRLAAQMSTEEKMNRAGFVVWTEGDQTITEMQLTRVLGSFTSSATKG